MFEKFPCALHSAKHICIKLRFGKYNCNVVNTFKSKSKCKEHIATSRLIKPVQVTIILLSSLEVMLAFLGMLLGDLVFLLPL